VTTYTPITDAEFDQNSPLTEVIGAKYRDNPIAMFEGASGAPNISYAAFGTLAAGADVKIAVTVNTASFMIVQPGVVRIQASGVNGGAYNFKANGVIIQSGNGSTVNNDYTLPGGPVTITITTSPIGGGTATLSLLTSGAAIWPASVTDLTPTYNGAT
jgi:hypothetical protein